MPSPDLVVIHEHPEWQKPLFAALERRGVPYGAFNVTQAGFSNDELPQARLYFNQASPSAYIRGNTRAVPLAMAFMRSMQLRGARVLNGADVFALELSKSAQATLLRALGVDTPFSITFNETSALRRYEKDLRWPMLLKPDQGGSGARIQLVNSLDEVDAIFRNDPSVWQPDNLFLLQEYLPHDAEHGIIRLEFVGGELLYAMRVVTHGRFNLCPSPVCNPDEGDRACEVPLPVAAPPVEFYPYKEVPPDAVRTATRIVQAAKLDVGGIEYLETPGGRRVFYDVNANSNLRPSVAAAFGFGQAGLVPAYVIVTREYYSVQEANWRIPCVLFGGTLGMAAGGYDAGLIFDWTANYLVAFGTGLAFNVLNFAILMFLFTRSRGLQTRLIRQPQTST